MQDHRLSDLQWLHKNENCVLPLNLFPQKTKTTIKTYFIQHSHALLNRLEQGQSPNHFSQKTEPCFDNQSPSFQIDKIPLRKPRYPFEDKLVRFVKFTFRDCRLKFIGTGECIFRVFKCLEIQETGFMKQLLWVSTKPGV